MTDAPPTLPPADWYPDPQSSGQQRWWSGTSWTEHTRLIPQLAPPVLPTPPSAHAAVLTSPEPPGRVRRGFLDSPFEPAGTPRNTLGNLALIFALVPFAISWLIPGVGLMLALFSGITAIVLGIVGIARAGRIGARRGTAIAGLVIGSISAIGVAVAVAVAVANATPSSIDTGDLESQISDWIYEQAGQVVEVECPANPPASTGSSFSCAVLGGVEISETVEVTVQDEQGTVTWHLAE